MTALLQVYVERATDLGQSSKRNTPIHATLDELWKINVGSGFAAPPMTFEVNGRQYLAIASGPSGPAKAKLINTPELKEQRDSTVLFVFSL